MILGWEEKRQLLVKAIHEFELDTFIETGTSDGEIVRWLSPVCKRVYSIELAEDFYHNAVRRTLDLVNVTLIYGNSGEVLQWLMPYIEKPSFLWLDAHFNGRGDGSNPIMDELRHVFYAKIPHVVFIDDAHLFGVDPVYPSVQQIINFLKEEVMYGLAPYSVNTADNIIKLCPV